MAEPPPAFALTTWARWGRWRGGKGRHGVVTGGWKGVCCGLGDARGCRVAEVTSSPPNWIRWVRASRSASLSLIPGTCERHREQWQHGVMPVPDQSRNPLYRRPRSPRHPASTLRLCPRGSNGHLREQRQDRDACVAADDSHVDVLRVEPAHSQGGAAVCGPALRQPPKQLRSATGAWRTAHSQRHTSARAAARSGTP